MSGHLRHPVPTPFHGPYDPAAGHRFNPRKVVLDPYAQAIARPLHWYAAVNDRDEDTSSCAARARVTRMDFDWQAIHVACLGMVLPGNQIDETNDQGDRIRDESFAILFNAHHETVPFRLGTQKYHRRWICELDTAFPLSAPRHFDSMSVFPLQPRSLVILRAEPLPPTEVVTFS